MKEKSLKTDITLRDLVRFAIVNRKNISFSFSPSNQYKDAIDDEIWSQAEARYAGMSMYECPLCPPPRTERGRPVRMALWILHPKPAKMVGFDLFECPHCGNVYVAWDVSKNEGFEAPFQMRKDTFRYGKKT